MRVGGAASGLPRLSRWAHRHAQWLFPAPAVLLVAVIIVYPIAYTGWMSLQEWFASSLTRPRFIGARELRQDRRSGDARFREAVVADDLLHYRGRRRRDDARGRHGAAVQSRVLGARPAPHAGHPADGGDAHRDRARVRDDVPPDARRGELPAVGRRALAVPLDVLELDRALRPGAGGRLAVDAADHAHRAGRSRQPAARALRGRASRRRDDAAGVLAHHAAAAAARRSSWRSCSAPSTRSRPSTSSS